MSLSLSPNSLYRQTTDCTEGGGLTREHCIYMYNASFVARYTKVIINTWQQQFIFFCEVIGRSHLIVKLSAICCYVNFGFSYVFVQVQNACQSSWKFIFSYDHMKVYLFIWSHNFRFSMSLSLSPNYRLHRRWRFNECWQILEPSFVARDIKVIIYKHMTATVHLHLWGYWKILTRVHCIV
jgi:hypothetical protein